VPVIYADADSDGVPDNNTPITTTGSVASGQSFNFVVAGTIPNGATAGQNATVTVTAQSTFDSTVSDSITDSIAVTNNAAITVAKSIDDSSGPSPSGPYTYTLTYTNNGAGAATNLIITDAIPVGMDYVENSARWNLSATPLDDSNNPADGDPAGIDYSFATAGNGTLTAVIASVTANSSGRITFEVNVNSNVAPGVIANLADFSYNDGATDRSGESNTNNFTVTRTVALTFDGPTNPTPSAAQGGVVDFINTLTNDGTGEDTFDIVVN
jgi:uncharacterized repeat protein (TIGR01451 family)